VYPWELPEDLGPLREAARALADRKVDISLFTTSTQLIHLFDLAAREGLQDEVGQGLRSTVICSIGPTTSETLREHGFEPDLEPSHPKLGLLVKEAAEQWVSLAARKSGAAV
jgi:uroporphyrinogen-III synthase